MCSLLAVLLFNTISLSLTLYEQCADWKDQFIIAEKWDHIIVHQHLPKEMPFHKNDIAEDAAAGILFNIFDESDFFLIIYSF